MDWADLGPKEKYSLLGQTRPRRQGWARTRLAQTQNGRGELISPHPCMQNAIRSACREGNKGITEQGREKSYLARGGGGFLRFWRCCGGSWWRRLVHGQRLPAALRLFPTVWFILSVPPFLFVFSVSFVFGLVLPLFPLLFAVFFRSPLFLLSPSFYLFPSLSSVFSFFPCSSPLFSSLFFSPSPFIAAVLAVIYRAKWVSLYCGAWGATGRSAMGRDCQGAAPPPRLSGRCAVGGRPLCPVGGLQARVAGKNSKKSNLFSFFPAAWSGEEDEQCRSKRHRSALSFFFFFLFVFECMKRRRFGENAPFHLNVAPKRAKFQISPQSSFLSSIASLPISVSVPLVGRVFHFSPWSLIYAIEPLIDQKNSNFFN